MKRMILTGILAIGTGAMCLMAQAPAAGQKGPAPKSKGEVEALQALQDSAWNRHLPDQRD